jgi:mannosyltransferase OCH1-like enzyme
MIRYIVITVIIFLCIMVINKSDIPKVIHQTYHDKSKIPQKVYDNIQKYAPEYKHIIYNDQECINFLRTQYTQVHVDAFNSFKEGAHKADFFRYCLLYKLGGVYLDIKTELMQPLSTLFIDNYLYTVIAMDNISIYQGIIATPPKNPIFIELIDFMLNESKHPVEDRLIFTKDFYNEILQHIKESKLSQGYIENIENGPDYFLFQEKKYPASECYDGIDRHNVCVYVTDVHGSKVIKTRYSDYPW